MIPSLSAAITGIDANQTMLDVVGNNIANVNTTGYQAQSAQFADLLNQQIAGATAPGPNFGGTNPVSVGSGTVVTANNTSFIQGTIVPTNVNTDVAIQGSGFLVGQLGNQQVYTRNGALTTNSLGQLTTSNGAIIQGWMAPTPGGTITTTAPVGPVSVPKTEVAPAKESNRLNLTGNVPAGGGAFTITQDAFDNSGSSIPVAITFTPTATAGQWTMKAMVGSGAGAVDMYATDPTVTFTNGQVSAVTGVTQNASNAPVNPNGFDVKATWASPPADFPQPFMVSFPAPSSPSAVTQYGGNQTVQVGSQDGYGVGAMTSFSIAQDGTINGNFSNGQTLALGQIALANFANPNGLVHAGGTNYVGSVNSGPPQLGVPSSAGMGSLLGGSLENSNVDLGTELTNLIIAQNAYQANTKVVTTSDQVLQALENMP
ncbi:MAG: flagellar hook protein FlgE [Acidimicrobiales bacterium]